MPAGDTLPEVFSFGLLFPPFAFHSVALRVPRFTRGINDWLQSKAPNVGVNELDSKVDFRFLVFKLLSLHMYEDAFDDRVGSPFFLNLA